MRRRDDQSTAFMLLEVVLALGILAGAAIVLMQSYTLGAKSVLRAELITQSCMLAEGLMDEFDIIPPETLSAQGDFGPNYPDFTWEVEVERETPRYRHSKADVEEFDDLITYQVKIIHRREGGKDYVPVHFAYHPPKVEKFSQFARYENQLLGDEGQ